MDITKRLNHDSCWLKISNGKEFAKLLVTRANVRSQHSPGMAELAKHMLRMFLDLEKTGANVGDILDKVAAEVAATKEGA